MRPEGFEPPTNGFGSHYSIRLSYERLAAHYARTAGARVMGLGDADLASHGVALGVMTPASRPEQLPGGRRMSRFTVYRVHACNGVAISSGSRQNASLLNASNLTVRLSTRPSAATAELAWQPAPPAAARLHQRLALAARNLDRRSQPHPMNSRPPRNAGHSQECRPDGTHPAPT